MSFRPHWRRACRLPVALVFLAIQASMSAQETTFNVDMTDDLVQPEILRHRSMESTRRFLEMPLACHRQIEQ